MYKGERYMNRTIDPEKLAHAESVEADIRSALSEHSEALEVLDGGPMFWGFCQIVSQAFQHDADPDHPMAKAAMILWRSRKEGG